MIRLNISPIFREHSEDIAADLRNMFRENIIDSVAFICSLCPEGNPPVDKGAEYAELFRHYRKLLEGSGLPTGILIQSSMGHGWLPAKPTPFPKIVTVNGDSPYIFCPENADFRKYIVDAVKKCAEAKPDFFMLDDDTRMITARHACYCQAHTNRFNALYGTNFQPDELREAVLHDRSLALDFQEMLRLSMVDFANIIRDAIDAVSPDLFCSFCQCSRDMFATPDMAEILAGKGRTPLVRINNGTYKVDSPRVFPAWLARTAEQLLTLPKDFTLIAEPDTCPQNRYATSAAFMRTNLTMSMMEGCKGGKLWITRTGYYEPKSGIAYRKALKEDAEIMAYACNADITWHGPKIPVPETPYCYMNDKDWEQASWHDVFGRMGLPFAFSRGIEKGSVTLLTERTVRQCTDQELQNAFAGNVILDALGARALEERGLGKLCGCKTADWDGERPSGENWNGRPVGMNCINVMLKLIPDNSAKVLSMLQFKTFVCDEHPRDAAPAAVLAQNHLGGTVITFAMRCMDYHGFSTPFTWLNETRKEQLIDFINLLQPMELYVVGDCETLFKYGIDRDGRRVAELLNIELDPLEEITLRGTWLGQAAKPVCPKVLNSDGTWKDVTWHLDDDGLLTIHACTLPARVTIFSL